jgi:hypothetical protein
VAVAAAVPMLQLLSLIPQKSHGLTRESVKELFGEGACTGGIATATLPQPRGPRLVASAAAGAFAAFAWYAPGL